MNRIVNEELAQIYLKLKMLDRHIVQENLLELETEGGRLDLKLLSKALVTEEQNAAVYSKFFDIEYMDINKIEPVDELVQLVSIDFVINNNVLPFAYDPEGRVYVAVADPFMYRNFYKMYSFLEGRPYHLVVSTSQKIKKIHAVVTTKASTESAISDYTNSDEANEDKKDSDGLDEDIANSPAVRLAESIIREGIAVSASDIHIEPFEKTVRVRNRIDGTLYEASTFDIGLYPAVSTRIKILAGVNIAEKRIPQDGRIKYVFNGVPYDFRVSTLPTVYGERIVIRVLDTENFKFTRDKLGFFPEENKRIDRMINLPYGIVLLTGPTGCGKSTTLYSFVQEITVKNLNIITVEDPVEYTLHGVNQVQVNNKANMTFAAALRSILRQDPNVIMIGEIRDEETAEIAIRSAITGHLVFSTLHTNDAPGAVTRLVDMGVQPYFVSDALSGIIAQRLVRRLCPHCKQAVKTTTKEMKVLGLKEPKVIYKPCGCPACNNTGYKGRLGIHEILEMDEDIRQLIQKGASTEEIRQLAKKNGMLTLKDTCTRQVIEGNTSMNELMEVIFDID